MTDVSSDDPALILYTSGHIATEGGGTRPWNLFADMQQYQATVGLHEGEVNLRLSPLFHAANVFCFVHLMLGGATVLLEKVEPEAIFTAIEREKVTFVFTVPTVLYKMLDYPERSRYDLTSLQAVQYGAAPITGPGCSRRCSFSAIA